MRRRRSCLSLVGSVVVGVLLVVVFAGPAVYVELSGATASGVVSARHEEIRMRYSGWTRSLRVEVQYTPADTEQQEVAIIPVTTERYDQVRIGDAVQVRYMPQPGVRVLGEIASPRLVDQGPVGQLRARVAGSAITFAFIGLFLLFLAAWGATRLGWLLVPVWALLLCFGVYAVSDPPQPAPPGPQLSTQATVRQVYEVDRLSSGRSGRSRSRAFREALQPYDMVALEFVPQGAAASVVAVDLVDVGSVQGLAVGAKLPISYSTADPRWAQIEGAQRTYFWKNLYGYAIVAGLVLLLALGVWIVRRRRRARSKLAQP